MSVVPNCPTCEKMKASYRLEKIKTARHEAYKMAIEKDTTVALYKAGALFKWCIESELPGDATGVEYISKSYNIAAL